MLYAIAIYGFVTGQLIQALPTSTQPINPPSPSACDDIHHCRTIWNIIWSCLVIIFSCTWIAIHPNIPHPDETSIKKSVRRVGLMAMAVIAPELAILWAMRQWFAARELARKHQKQGWTVSHGFFALMGGFMLFDGDRAIRTLQPDQLVFHPDPEDGQPAASSPERSLISVRVDFPRISEEEIRDRSKGDMLAKGLVVMQTGWFILQSIARRIERLPTTQLEIATLAFATLNFATYVFWWDKPLNVQRPFRVFEEGADHGQGVVGREDLTTGGDSGEGISFAAVVTGINKLFRELRTSVSRSKPCSSGVPIREDAPTATKRVLKSIRERDSDGWMDILVWVPYRFVEMGSGNDIEVEEMRVPSFYSGDLGNDRFAMIVVFAGGVTAMVFGAIHCVAWSFEFPSPTERLLWRVSSLAIICVPGIPFLATLSLAAAVALLRRLPLAARDWVVKPFRYLGQLFTTFEDTIAVVGVAISAAFMFLYIFARVGLLVIAFTSLRSLPPGAYRTVYWTTFIPHI